MKGKLPADLHQFMLGLSPESVDWLLSHLDAEGQLDALDSVPAEVDTSDDPEQIASWISQNCRLISDQGKGVIPFTLFDYQRAVIAAYEEHREVIVLKARQLGMTELTAAFALFKMCHHTHYTVIVLSKGEAEANEFLGKVRVAFDHLPSGSKPSLRNPSLTSRLELDNGSRMIPLPTTTSAGRSYNAQLLVLDEWAHQMHQQEVYTAAAPIARSAGNKIIGLSSANGDGNFFSRMWHHATDAQRQGDTSAPHPIFLPWHVRPGRDAAWYKAATSGLEPWQRAQEFPADPDEAFILSGRPRFDVDALRDILSGCREPVQTTQDSGGTLCVWGEPDPTRRYVIGADPAEGLLKGDFSVAVVLDMITGVEVAAARGRWEPGTFAGLLRDLGWHYGTALGGGVVTPALLGVEANNHGHAVLLALRDGHGYPHLYHHTEYNAQAEGTRLGWLSTTRSKPLMIDGLAAAIRERRPYRWRQFAEEALRYVVLDDGKTAASGDYHDDTVTATAIAEQMRLWQPTQAQVVSLAQEVGSTAEVAGISGQSAAAPTAALAGGWTITNDLGDVIDPWSRSGFYGVVDSRY